MNGSGEANDEESKDDEGSLASAEDSLTSLPTLASSSASTTMSSASSSHGTVEEDADEQSMLVYSFEADIQC
jgi:hypothetical protein